MNKKTLNFIEELIKIESKNLKNNKSWNNVYDKYSNGHCEDLALFLIKYNSNGELFRISGKYEIDDNLFEHVIHYVYKLDDKLYDINGEFDNVEDLIYEFGLIDYIDSAKEHKINDYAQSVLDNLDNNKLYSDIISNLKNLENDKMEVNFNSLSIE